jgi:hypothetical protein
MPVRVGSSEGLGLTADLLSGQAEPLTRPWPYFGSDAALASRLYCSYDVELLDKHRLRSC